MTTRKIKDAKDLSDDSLIYFKSHAKATYMSDGSTVEDAINDIKVNGSENTDLSDYETKVESQNKLLEAKSYTDNKTDELRDVVTQTLSLTSNYNWYSFYVDITLEQLQQAFGTNVTSITTSFDGTTEVTSSYDANTNTWSGDLTSLDVTKMYMINANTSCEISLTGRKISNSTVYTLNPGWNWIGYPLNQEVDINTALKGLVATEGDKIKFRGNTFAEYFDGEWYPVDFVFEPGQGYKYYNASTEPNTLVFTTELIDTKSELNKKQDVLVSGTNIKTINGESLLGEGNIVISGGSNSSGGAYALVEHGTNDTTYTLTPNTFHVWDEVTNLTLTLDNETSGVANEYLFQFTSGATATTLSLPSDLKWANDSAPIILPNMIYQVSILKGLASVLEFSNEAPSVPIVFYVNDTPYDAMSNMTWNDFINSEYNPPLYQETMFKVEYNKPVYAWSVFSEDDYEYAAIQHSDNLADTILTEYILPKHYIAG